MNTLICMLAFAIGALVVAWVGGGYINNSPLALTVTALIGIVYLVGALELLRFHATTTALARALATIPPDLTHPREWLARLPGSLQNPVRLRLEGERVGLPGPALTPYLVGLLVLLGMLGTFLGMVVTLQGAVVALESTTDLETIRTALAAPVKGLGVAFGTSVAGVAASAMLGLISALCRRAQIRTAQVLDTRIATDLRDFSAAHQRQATYTALQLQARMLPELVDNLQRMMAQMERHQIESNDQMLAEQARFYRETQGLYTGLARSVEVSLKESLSASARIAGETLQPVVEATMSALAHETTQLHTRVAESVSQQLDGLAARFDTAVGKVAESWSTAVAHQTQCNEALQTQLHDALEAFADTFGQRSAELVAEIGEAQAGLQAQIGTTLADTARDISADAKAGTRGLLAEVAGLMQTAAEAPRAAAAVIAELRETLAASMVRDNASLAERNRIMEALSSLLTSINQTAYEQREAIDTLVAASTALLERAGSHFAERIADESARLSDLTAQLGGGAVEVASLSEAFGLAVQHFSESNDKLMTTLQRIEGALDKSMTRSDEQLAYYVAQAREIIDLSIMSQKQIVEDLQQLTGNPTARVSGA